MRHDPGNAFVGAVYFFPEEIEKYLAGVPGAGPWAIPGAVSAFLVSMVAKAVEYGMVFFSVWAQYDARGQRGTRVVAHSSTGIAGGERFEQFQAAVADIFETGAGAVHSVFGMNAPAHESATRGVIVV